ncbi:MAG: BON domain-containing protein [Planctomycetaceae bacterium]|nr:BON domain-containing protein [Planctomycetaceae bacterium]
MIATNTTSPESEVLNEVHQALSEQLFRLSQNLTCEFREGLLLLRGRVSSYYHKQVAQEAVRRLDAVDQIINQIEVVPA